MRVGVIVCTFATVLGTWAQTQVDTYDRFGNVLRAGRVQPNTGRNDGSIHVPPVYETADQKSQDATLYDAKASTRAAANGYGVPRPPLRVQPVFSEAVRDMLPVLAKVVLQPSAPQVQNDGVPIAAGTHLPVNEEEDHYATKHSFIDQPVPAKVVLQPRPPPVQNDQYATIGPANKPLKRSWLSKLFGNPSKLSE